MKTVICALTLVLVNVLTFAPSARADVALELGEAERVAAVKPVGYTVEIEDWSGTKVKRLNALFELSACEAGEIKSAAINVVVFPKNRYVVTFQGSGSNDCGIEMDPPKFIYKVNLGYFGDIPSHITINEQRLSLSPKR